MEKSTFTFSDLWNRYEDKTELVTAQCVLATELVGGQPAGPEGVTAYVKHHLKLEGEQAEEAIKRILQEEIGERDVPSETGELKEKLTYSVNVVRRSKYGPWLGDWMVKACLKAAASRLGIFQEKRGSKGDIAEMGTVRSNGISFMETDHPERIYLCDKSGKSPAQTYFQEFMGRVGTPQGSKSIVTDAECVATGSRFSFSLRFKPGRITQNDIVDIFACAMVIGLGSAKSFERGKFRIASLTVGPAEAKVTKPKRIAVA